MFAVPVYLCLFVRVWVGLLVAAWMCVCAVCVSLCASVCECVHAFVNAFCCALCVHACGCACMRVRAWVFVCVCVLTQPVLVWLLSQCCSIITLALCSIQTDPLHSLPWHRVAPNLGAVITFPGSLCLPLPSPIQRQGSKPSKGSLSLRKAKPIAEVCDERLACRIFQRNALH